VRDPVTSAQLLEFTASSLAIIIVPGPSVLFAIARGIAWGRAVALLTVLGNGLGIFALAGVIAAGIGPLLARSATFTEGVEVAGGCYLLWLGAHALAARRAHAEAMQRQEPDRPGALTVLRQGFVVGLLNPKALIFFIAVFPHFVNRASGDVTFQLFVLGAIFSSLAVISDSVWGFGAGAARDRLRGSARLLEGLRAVGGTVMLCLGTLIIVTAVL
jgi:threonine/homoserine/homoserine lactone efflux protein